MQEQQSTNNQGSSLWIGLESYQESNSAIFFGRDEDIRQLSGDIFNNIQTVIYGPSGTGKTSIIRAGIFKIARENRYLPVYVRLNHETGSRPYTQQIIDAIKNEAEKHNIDIENTSPYITEIESTSPNKKEKICMSLWEYFHTNEFWNEENYPVVPLIVVDQFEEIFTLGKNLSLQPDFFNQLSDLCDNKYPQYVVDYLNDRKNERIEYPETINYRFVISLREDFLARLEEQAETIPALKRNRFSLQCINEEQALDIILKPQPGLVSEDVAALIIEKVTNKKFNEDFKFHDEPEILVEPAILSLFCRELDKKRCEKDLSKISSDLIGEFGDNIIREFYVNSLSSLSEGNEENNSPLPTQDEKIDYLESRLITVDGFRDAVAYQNAIAFGFTQKDIKTLIDNRLVRIDEWDGTRRIEFIHDVLCRVANKHRKEREQEKESEKKEEEIKELKAETEQIRRKNRKRLKLIAIGAALLVLFGYGWYDLWYKPYSVYYGNFTTVGGWPTGLGDEVNEEKAKEDLIVHYRLTRKGRMFQKWNSWLPQRFQGKPFTKVEVVDIKGNLTTNKFHETPIVGLLETEMNDEKASAFAKMQKETAYWIYSPGDQDFKEVARCTAFNMEKKELYSIQYYKEKTFASSDENKYVQWAVFNDANGKQMMVTDNGADRMRQTVWNGAVTGCLFFTELGTPQKNAYDAYGYQYEVNDSTHLVQRQYCVDKFGTKIDSTEIDVLNYKYGRIAKTSLYEVKHPKKGEIVYQFKTFNDTLQFNENGTLGYGSFHTFGGKYSKIVFKYNSKGLPILNQKYDNKALVESRNYSYLDHASKKDSILVLQNGVAFTEKYSYPNDTTIEISFWKAGSRYSLWRTNEFGDSLFYHKSITKQSSDSLRIKLEYQDELYAPISYEGVIYSSYSRIMDNKNKKNVKLEYFYDSQGEICKSEWFEYDEYGNRIARSVAGVDGTPVRCPNWDWDGLTFYKMAVLYPFNNSARSVFVSTKGLNEFGEESYITRTKENEIHLLSIKEIGYHYMYLYEDGIIKTGVAIAGTNDIKRKYQHPALYLHLLSKTGTFYKTGLKDGDIILKCYNISTFPISERNLNSPLKNFNDGTGGEVVVARAIPHEMRYNVLTFFVPNGDACAEIHPVDLTETEYFRLKSNI